MKLKLIWEFRGGEAEGIAKHHSKHLGEFAHSKNYPDFVNGTDSKSPYYCLAYLILNKDDAEEAVKILKPHRIVELQT